MNIIIKLTKTLLLAVVISLGSFLSVSASGVDTTFDPGSGANGAIKRMQTFLGTKADGYVGPLTRGLINNSCGK